MIYHPELGRPAQRLEPEGFIWSACKQTKYFGDRPKVVCWADKEGVDSTMYYDNGCDSFATTEIMLCLHHYRRIFGHDPKD